MIQIDHGAHRLCALLLASGVLFIAAVLPGSVRAAPSSVGGDIPIANASFDTFVKPGDHNITGAWSSIGLTRVNDASPVFGWSDDAKVMKFSDGTYAGNDKSSSKGIVDMLGWQRQDGPDWGIKLIADSHFGGTPHLLSDGDPANMHFGTGDWTAINTLNTDVQANAGYTVTVDVGFPAGTVVTPDVLNQAIIQLKAGDRVLSPASVAPGDYGTAPLGADTIKTWTLVFNTGSHDAGKLSIVLGGVNLSKTWVCFFKVKLSKGPLAPQLLKSTSIQDISDLMDASVFTRSVVSKGDVSRLQRVMAKARAGQPITVAAIGGSITAGARASKWELNYCSQVGAWWKKAFPKSNVTVVNAGIGATGSNYAALRAQRDLLSKHPDAVVVEFAVNDAMSAVSQPGYEGLLRQILSQPQQPAVVMMFMMHEGGANAQDFEVPLGKLYNLPMISYRDAAWPLIQGGNCKWEDLMADGVHPNDAGHALAAKLITSFLDGVDANLSVADKLGAAPLPAPLSTDAYQFCHLYEPKDIKPARADGWTLNDKGQFVATEPGSVFECDVEGRNVSLMSWRIRGAMGRVKAQVDNGPATVIDAWFDQTWGGYLTTDIIAKDLPAGVHHVRIEVLPDKDDQSTGHEIHILGLGTTGATQ
ncbi:MAG: SGNH/GDSL hydrolase family protein [Capsulimonadaceae bacterium]|nr:SGNH/GDSL hydrolase family protein [Capsulimonadaceae bacterium]